MREQIPAALDAERVDRVASLMTGLSRSMVTSLIVEGKLTRNDEVVVAGSQRVVEGDWIEVEVPAQEHVDKHLVPDPEVVFDETVQLYKAIKKS